MVLYCRGDLYLNAGEENQKFTCLHLNTDSPLADKLGYKASICSFTWKFDGIVLYCAELLSLREHLLVLWKHGQPSKCPETLVCFCHKGTWEHRNAMGLCEPGEAALVGAGWWPGKLLSAGHSGWLRLLRTGLAMVTITSASVSWCPWCRGDWWLHAYSLKALPGSPPGPQRALTACSWMTLDPAGQWGRLVRELWEASWESHKTLDSRAVFNPSPCPWCLSNLLCRNSILCLSDFAFALMIWLPRVTWASLIPMDLFSDHRLLCEAGYHHQTCSAVLQVLWDCTLSSEATALHCPSTAALPFPCGAGPPCCSMTALRPWQQRGSGSLAESTIVLG